MAIKKEPKIASVFEQEANNSLNTMCSGSKHNNNANVVLKADFGMKASNVSRYNW